MPSSWAKTAKKSINLNTGYKNHCMILLSFMAHAVNQWIYVHLTYYEVRINKLQHILFLRLLIFWLARVFKTYCGCEMSCISLRLVLLRILKPTLNLRIFPQVRLLPKPRFLRP